MHKKQSGVEDSHFSPRVCWAFFLCTHFLYVFRCARDARLDVREKRVVGERQGSWHNKTWIGWFAEQIFFTQNRESNKIFQPNPNRKVYCCFLISSMTFRRAAVSSPQLLMTTHEHPTTFRGCPSASILQSPAHCPSSFEVSTYFRTKLSEDSERRDWLLSIRWHLIFHVKSYPTLCRDSKMHPLRTPKIDENLIPNQSSYWRQFLRTEPCPSRARVSA